MNKKYRNSSGEECQPPEWEEKLQDVTVNRNYHEVPYDPGVLTMISELTYELPFDGPVDVLHDSECVRQIEQVRDIAQRKLKGLQRQCLLMMLSTGAGYRKLAAMLRVSEDTVRRQVHKACATVKQNLHHVKPGEFPAKRGTRPTFRSAVLPLDTDDEKKDFLSFINAHVPVHIAYNASGSFREALVIYLSGKPASRNAMLPAEEATA